MPRAPQQEAGEVLAELRAFLAEQMGREATRAGGEPVLRDAVRSYRWQDARELAATLAQKAPPQARTPLTAVETVYAVTLAYSVPAQDSALGLAALRAACLALLGTEKSQYSYYVPEHLAREQDLATRGLLLAVGGSVPEPGSSSESLAEALAGLLERPQADPAYAWAADLFHKASWLGGDGSARLADQLWEGLRGKDNDEARADLLRLLFRMRRYEALRHLTYHAEPIDDLIRLCLGAFAQAEEDSSVRPQAREVLLNLREQAFGKRNTRPWISLFQSLEATRNEEGDLPVQCTLLSDAVVRDAAGGPALVQVLLTPGSDLPRSLQLQFLTDPAAGAAPPPVRLLGEEEMLLQPRSVEVTVPEAALVVAGPILDVGYRLTGLTLRKKPIDLEGRWRLPNTYRHRASLPDHEIASAWPGASGDPVVSDLPGCGFHGREDEKVRIDKYLRAPGRGRSLMVFGQRRIGKTSLLLEMVRYYPPRSGAMCGAFFDFNSLDTPAGPGAMQRAFFDFVVSKLATEPINEPLRRALPRSCRLETLARGLHPEIALEDALAQLVDRLRQESRGRISRVAFFFDEFDRFVEPLMTGQREEVLKLHGSLRQIIQRSQQISLVIAGSGLQRLFTDDYLHPFYGSIDELELRPFDWTTERGRLAAEKTFLPADLRPRLCPGERFAEVAQRACDLTGGHPYYLSMLGFATARAWRGHPLTPALLNRVADLMIQDKIDGGICDINHRKFYQFIFESLKRLSPREQAVAQLMLAGIARLTSTERQRWKKWKLIVDQFIEDPQVRRLTTEEERLTALQYLEKERVVELDKNRVEVRIRIPLTAAAVREDAREIHDRAIRLLEAAGEAGQ
jgi:hypothetical protein